MIPQVIILFYIMFSFYSLSYWISNVFRRHGTSEKIVSELFIPLLFSVFSFYILIAFGGNAFLLSLIPIIIFSSSVLILPSILLAFVSPILPVLVLPFIFYTTLRSIGRRFTYTKPTILSLFIPIVAIISIGFGSYLIYLFPISLTSFLIASISVPIIDLVFERIDMSKIVLFSFTFFLPIAAFLRNIKFSQNLLIVVLILSLIPLVRSLHIYSRRENKS